ncbi:sugar transferase [Oceanicola sp. D3]|uniref:sugar transferase n=1 Tax=Oceanicola sp. D3 TaxID=2587163 RepID=UPI0020C7E378|nr:sugar transferase [Oceanicola sp. D3]
MVTADERHGLSYMRHGKRVFDFSLALVLLPLVLPVILVLCAITRRDGAPGLFGHERVGRNGQPFNCWKIRSMVPNAKERLAEHLASNPEAAAEWERDFKLDNDPRITRLGHFIRKTSLDELPQLWNVLVGDMSFVGPRPIVASELARYGEHRREYLSVRPGITGPWQVSGRNDISYAERVRMDASYAHSMNLPTDVALIFKTVGVVFAPTGK